MRVLIPAVLAALTGLCVPAAAQSADCGAAPTATVSVPLPARPFSTIAQGCSIFVSLIVPGLNGGGKIALLRRDGDAVETVRIIDLRNKPSIMALTRDGKWLIAADMKDVAFIDIQRLVSGEGDPILGYIDDESGPVAVAVSPDDRTLFVSDEKSTTVTVIDLDAVRAGGFSAHAVLGKIPVGSLPVGLAVSRDGRFLYSTSQIAPVNLGWPIACAGGQGKTPVHAEGALLVIDVALARSDPAHAVLGQTPAGCNAVRVALSPADDRAYVTARSSDAVIVLDTAKILSEPDAARIASVPTGDAPVGIALLADGVRLVVTNSNRFARDPNGKESLTVIDTAKVADGADAVLGKVTVGAFPRELFAAEDGILLVTNFLSNELMLVPTNPLPLQ